MLSTFARSTAEATLTITQLPCRTEWQIDVALTASLPLQATPIAKNFIFLLDVSGSMSTNDRLKHVKTAIGSLLKKLTDSDTFSIVTFNDAATLVTKENKATEENRASAIRSINQMQADGDTDFSRAFQALRNHDLISAKKCPTIIFLTDGENNFNPEDLLGIVTYQKRSPRIIPIGIFVDKNRDKLNALYTLSGGTGTQAIYIQQNNLQAYENAFQTAFQLAVEQSKTPVQIEMTIQAADDKNENTTVTTVKRTRDKIIYDGKYANKATIFFNSIEPPSHVQLAFSCEGHEERAEWPLSQEEKSALFQNKPAFYRVTKPARLPTIESKQKQLRPGASPLSVPPTSSATASLAPPPPVQTTSLPVPPTSPATASLVTSPPIHTTPLPAPPPLTHTPSDKKAEPVTTTTTHLNWMQPKNYLGVAILSASGATTGYVTGTAASTAIASTLTTAGISASLFISCCTVGGAIILPLLVCYLLRSSKTSPPSTSKKFLANTTMMISGAAVGFFSGTAAATSMTGTLTMAGISTSLFLNCCTAGGTIILPILVHYLMTPSASSSPALVKSSR